MEVALTERAMRSYRALTERPMSGAIVTDATDLVQILNEFHAYGPLALDGLFESRKLQKVKSPKGEDVYALELNELSAILMISRDKLIVMDVVHGVEPR